MNKERPELTQINLTFQACKHSSRVQQELIEVDNRDIISNVTRERPLGSSSLAYLL
jgi:hypothetical protein